MLSKNKSLWNHGDIFLDPIKQLIREDLARGVLRIYPNLTEAHITPSPWQKMNVKLAVQILSKTVGDAMMKKGYPALEKFLAMIDEWFDCVNAGFYGRKSKHGREPYNNVDDKQLRWLSNDFLQYLQKWEENAATRSLIGQVNREMMLLSNATRSGFKICTLSMGAIIKLTLTNGAGYVLPRRINQDTLEAYFGQQRESAVRTRNPSNDKNIALLSAK